MNEEKPKVAFVYPMLEFDDIDRVELGLNGIVVRHTLTRDQFIELYGENALPCKIDMGKADK